MAIDPTTGRLIERPREENRLWPAPGAPGNPLKQENQNEFMFPSDKYPYSGLPESYRDQLLSFVMPQLRGSVENYSSNIDDFTQQALGSYRQEFDKMIKDILPREINQLANRGILSSTVASDTLGRATSEAARASATKGYETGMQAALMRANIPNTLAGLLQYGQSTQDPSVMYRTMAQLLASL